MPNRIIREGILASRPVDLLSLAAELFFRRLLNVLDDYGRFYADPVLLRSACYPLRIDKLSNDDVLRWLAECEDAGLLTVYTAVNHERFIQLHNFGQQIRAKSSKHPEPAEHMRSTCAADAKQMPSTCAASAHLDVSVSESESVKEHENASPSAPTPRTNRGQRLPEDWAPSPELSAWARKKRPDLNPTEEADAFRDHFRAAPGDKGIKLDWNATFRNWIRRAHAIPIKGNGGTVTKRPALRDLTGGGHE